ncbi:helicase-related protein [Oleispirillum naphthae]|uniref:helicase-related protein n=1 Tax=Oleispirillum naphthae TaxID=2838853 RepID=UPI00308256D2
MANIQSSRARVAAILGPTNTGKTHYAIDRLMAHASGMIGFPLRLLARENYDRVVRVRGAAQVALVTGEEKIIPPNPRYFICTVEAMPLDRVVDFLAVDEIQMCADAERGHVFTDRLLHARGVHETLFLGSDTMRGVISRLVPGIEVQTRPRLSRLSFAGSKKLARLPRRTAVVAFSAADVYAIADMVRRHRGGAAVVLGALSPRTRNAQVEMYQSGEVDFLVATDAIGMGLNMDIDHVAFAQTVKFDGDAPRRLSAAEIGQIAGRAGRAMNDGTFGTTADAPPFDAETVERVESHEFRAVRALFWRSRVLKFQSVESLLKSLLVSPPGADFLRARRADDVAALESLARMPEVAARAAHPDRVRLLWDICQIPDFQKIMPEAHARLLRRLFLYLTGDDGVIPDAFLSRHLARIDRTDGDIVHLSQRIAQIRVWTTVANHAAWVSDTNHWRECTRLIEDRLSDALHDRLTQKFVDRRTAILLSRLKGQNTLEATVTPNGDVHIEGQRVGRIEGLGFIAELGEASDQAEKVVAIAASKALRGEIAARAQALSVAPDATFSLAPDGGIAWHGTPVARLFAGASRLKPRVEVLPNELLDDVLAGMVHTRIQGWIDAQVKTVLRPLVTLSEAELPGLSRGIAFRLVEAGGTLRRGALGGDLAHLSDDDRKAMGKLGVRFGVETVYLPDMLKPAAQRLLLVLTAIDRKVEDPAAFVGAHSPLTPGQVSFPLAEGVAAEWVELQGYRVFDRRAARVDMLERFAAEVRRFLRDEALTTKVDSAPAKLKAEDEAPAETPAAEAAAEAPAETPAAEAAAEAPAEAPDAAPAEASAAPAAETEPEKPAAPQGAKILPPALMSLLGVGAEDTMAILRTLGYRVTDAQEGLAVQPKKNPKKAFPGRRPPAAAEGQPRPEGAPPRERGPRPERGDRPERGPRPDRPERGDRPRGPRPEGKGPRPDKGPRPAEAAKPARRFEVDPDSPFAVLKNWGKTKPES